MTFLVYETKFTVGESKEMVFTEGKGRDRWGKLDTLGGNSPKEMYRKKHCSGMTVDRQATITVDNTKPDLNSEHS